MTILSRLFVTLLFHVRADVLADFDYIQNPVTERR